MEPLAEEEVLAVEVPEEEMDAIETAEEVDETPSDTVPGEMPAHA